ncbi:hypothetical protein DRJ00_07975 [Candidatus Aerophobetes bacterium]|uniref:Uncharacterized protein n=1 Tax=Aerophobetes bacterium TaxID=2030807 RepID=A0A497E2F4_UNCAE|nr:MAG: hypothetical protein DRJ00_07975 [Candidatus Aerophobetes bacterium]
MEVKVKIRGKKLAVSSEDVEKVAEGLSPEGIRKHYIVVNGRRFPPKQLLEGILKMKGVKMDRLLFTTKDAYYLFTRLGFPSGRLEELDKKKRGLLALEELKGVIAVGGNAVVDSEKYYE